METSGETHNQLDKLLIEGKNGMSVIADMGIFYHFTDNNKDALIEFERSLPSKFDINLKRICN
jgi:hypothetical protein